MRGTIEVNRLTGQIDSQLVAENLGTNQDATQTQLDQLGQTLTYIMQDVNLYAKRNGGEAQLGQLSKINLKLDEHHAVSITCTPNLIKAQFEPLSSTVLPAQ